MLQSNRACREILRDVLSDDPHKIWYGACEIISLGQSRARILPLLPYLRKLRRRFRGIELGGAIAPNSRFTAFAIKTMEFHKKGGVCPCALYPMSGQDCIYDPNQQAGQGNVVITETVYEDGSSYVDYYMVTCTRCGRRYKVIEREYHYTWWEWSLAE